MVYMIKTKGKRNKRFTALANTTGVRKVPPAVVRNRKKRYS